MFPICRSSRGIPRALVALLASAILPAQTVLFIPQTQTATGANPLSLAIGDFNSDGRPDVAVTDGGPSAVEILLGLGAGFFRSGDRLTVGLIPRAIATGDFNRDGRADLAVANFTAQTVTILLGNGNGFFRFGVTLNAQSPSAIVVGDFNSDGTQDLAVSNANSNTVSIFLGIGEGSFLAPATFAIGIRPVAMAIGNFNGDGRPDLAVVNSRSGDVSILRGGAGGFFLPALNFAAGLSPAAIAVGDFNGDGRADVAVVNSTPTGTVTVLPGNGNGTLQSASNVITIPNPPPLVFVDFNLDQPNPAFLVAADFNLDGKVDLAVANTGSRTVSVLLGAGKGIFVPPFNFDTGEGPAWMGVADFNGDGRPDLAVANNRSSTVSVLLNRTVSAHQPIIVEQGLRNGASFLTGAVAPGEAVTIFGSNLGPGQLSGIEFTGAGLVATTLSGTRVLFDGILAPLLFARTDQVGVITPFAIAGREGTQVVVERNGVQSAPVTVAVAASAPGLFTADTSGQGQGAILNEDQSINSASNPAVRGSIVSLFGTGAGQTDPAGVDGQVAVSIRAKPVLPVFVTVAGQDAPVLSAGTAADMVAGVIRVDIRLPVILPSGAVPVVLRVGGAESQPGVTLFVGP